MSKSNDSSERSRGFRILSRMEKETLESLVDILIPGDENGPGALEGGVVEFIDHRLAGQYGNNGRMYMRGPFIQPGIEDAIEVEGIEYPNGSPSPRMGAGTYYQYPISLREFWKLGISYLNEYTNKEHDEDFRDLEDEEKTRVLGELWDNKPNNFKGPMPREFFHELYNLVVAGFFADPIYHGNKEMVGWKLLAFPGVSNALETGYTKKQLATLPELVKIEPKSLSDIQEGE